MKHTESIGCDPTELKNTDETICHDNRKMTTKITAAPLLPPNSSSATNREKIIITLFHLSIFCSSSFLFGLLPMTKNLNSMRPKSKYNHRFMHWIYTIYCESMSSIWYCLPFAICPYEIRATQSERGTTNDQKHLKNSVQQQKQ